MDSVKNASLTHERTNGRNRIYRTLPALPAPPGAQLPGEEAVVVVATAGRWYLNTHQCIPYWLRISENNENYKMILTSKVLSNTLTQHNNTGHISSVCAQTHFRGLS